MLKEKLLILLKIFLIVFATIIYLEFVFRARVFTIKFDLNLFRVVLFSLSYSVFILFFLMFFSDKTIKKLFTVSIVLLTFLYFNHEIYHLVKNDYFSISISGDFLDALGFLGRYFQSFKFGHLAYFVPLTSLYLYHKYGPGLNYNIQYYTVKQPLLMLFAGIVFYLVTIATISSTNPLNGEDEELFTDWDLYVDLYSADFAIYKFGMLTYSQRDLLTIFDLSDVDEGQQFLDIERFFSEQPYHNPDNYYSGSAEDKNFILIMAESLDTYGIVPGLTPMLETIKQDSLYFENYYSPLYYRNTADTEFLVQTSLYPNKSVSLSMEAYIDNYFPNTMPRLFNSYQETNYETFSFHNYTDYFYPRTDFHGTTLGFDHYFGSVQMEMQEEPSGFILNHEWQSDITLMENVVDTIFDDEYEFDNFYVNILTVSGHLDYNDKHPIAIDHYQTVADYDDANDDIEIPEDIRYYLAAQIEFDLALTYLIDELKDRGVFEDTVIMIFGDHYAYGLDVDTIWEYDTIKDNESNIDIHNVPMMIYNTGLESKVLPNYMSSIDIMPTVASLFSLDLDYRQIIGKDALDDDENIVRLANSSFVGNNIIFDIILSDDITKEIAIINDGLIYEYQINNMILETDYYRKKEPLQ